MRFGHNLDGFGEIGTGEDVSPLDHRGRPPEASKGQRT